MQLKLPLLISLLALCASAVAQTAAPVLQQFVIERDMPGAAKMSTDDMRQGAAKSNGVLREMGPDIQWLHSYVAGDKVYCVYNATSEALLRDHAARAGFPISKVTPVHALMTPLSANAGR